MKGFDRHFSERRALLSLALQRLAPAALTAGILSAQSQFSLPPGSPRESPEDESRLPNGKNRQEAIAGADYDQNLKDARELMDLARAFEEGLEKDDRFILSLSSLKKLDEMEKLTKRIRGRLKHI